MTLKNKEQSAMSAKINAKRVEKSHFITPKILIKLKC